MLFLFIVALLVSFYLLAQVSDKYFIPALDKIAKELKLSDDMAGATLMAVGSSAPELFVALIAVLKPGNHVEIGMGTIVGSAIFNILVIIGAIALVRTAVINWQPVLRDTMFYILSIALLFWFFYDGKILLIEAVVFVIFYLFYVFMVVKWRNIFPYTDPKADEPKDEPEVEVDHKWRVIFKPLDFILDRFFRLVKNHYSAFMISIGIIGILCWVLVESAVHISNILNIPEVFIALIVLAAGTSVPDMISSVIVAKQGRGGMAISNALGSNIFDILIGLGLPWLLVMTFSVDNIPVSKDDLVGSVVLLFGSVITVFALLVLRKWKIGYRSGIILIGLYIIFLIWEIIKLI